MNKLSTCLWFNGQALEAAKFYCSVFKKSKLGTIARNDPETAKNSGRPVGSVLVVTFSLDGMDFMALNGGPGVKYTDAVSMVVRCKTQKEIDYYWKKLTSGGGKPVFCGWLKDKYGLSWQVAPALMDKVFKDKNIARQQRFMTALMKMVKLDLKTLEKAYRQK